MIDIYICLVFLTFFISSFFKKKIKHMRECIYVYISIISILNNVSVWIPFSLLCRKYYHNCWQTLKIGFHFLSFSKLSFLKHSFFRVFYDNIFLLVFFPVLYLMKSRTSPPRLQMFMFFKTSPLIC